MSVWEGVELDNIDRTVSTNNSTSAISCVRKCLGVTAVKVRMTSDGPHRRMTSPDRYRDRYRSRYRYRDRYRSR